ncbi:uncharacterized protein N7496_005708 [Penicillium cataractarum]|uniref:Uncharacterized protein n=1 Tax=Penicillium cataractarum TaxID=2100454 RepID=A0A9W9SIE8_9EURO|nr:uncharacterized protein N7496_005708 [Penicillium cataractarum]KAJ5378299.1 hypothetical protein N7496_005708 [Penicillium cataractarum]
MSVQQSQAVLRKNPVVSSFNFDFAHGSHRVALFKRSDRLLVVSMNAHSDAHFPQGIISLPSREA